MKRVMPLVALMLAGCVPYNYELVPEVSGRVVDQSGNGATGLWVGVIEKDPLTKKEQLTATTTTDKDGRFLLPPLTGWGVYFLAQEPYAPHGYRLEVRRGVESLYASPLVDYGRGIHPRQWVNTEIKVRLDE